MPPEQDDTSTLEQMRRKLYAPEAPAAFPAPAYVPTQQTAEKTAWVPPVVTPKKKRISYAALFLGVAGIFFLIALGAATYFLVFGSRTVSTDHIGIEIDGPSTISSGDTVTLLIAIENKNPVPALETTLAVEFPDTARSPENQEEPFTHYEDTLGTIAPGETSTRSVRAVLFGAENQEIEIPVRFEYRVEGSNATYVKEEVYTVVITSSPISIRAEAVSEVSVGQPITFAVTVRSNAKEPVQDIAVLAQYPFGFQAQKGEGPLFPIGTLTPGEEKTIAVRGTLSGEDDEERVFRFTAGVSKATTTNILSVSYATTPVMVSLRKPFLATTLSVDRDASASPVVSAGLQVQSIVSWVNTLAVPVYDGQVSVKLAGGALDTSSIEAHGGYYRSSDMSVTYTKEQDVSLGQVAPGASGSGTFSFRTKPAAELAVMKNPTITATVSVSGRRVGEQNVPENVSSSLVRTIKVGTDLNLVAGSRYSAGPFKNTGPWPPAVDQETTYTIDFSLANTVNTVADGTVTAVLPSYVRYTGATSPADGSVSYNAATRTVTWKAGEVEAGVGYGTTARRQASFQVALLPSASQRGTSPILLTSIKATGFDKFTQKQLSVTHYNVTTQTTNDPLSGQGKAEVK